MASEATGRTTFLSFVDILYVVVITVGVEQTAQQFRLLPDLLPTPTAVTLAISIIFVALSWVYYHQSVQEDPSSESLASWLQFGFQVGTAFSYIGLFLTLTSPLYFGEVLATIYALYGLHGFSSVLRFGWYRSGASGIRPTSVPAFWLLFVPLLAISGRLLSPLATGPLWEQYIPPIVFLSIILISRWLRHSSQSWAYRGMVLLRLEPRLTPRRRVGLIPRCSVAIDVDGTIADQVPHVLERVAQEKNIHLTRDQITEWDYPIGGEPFTSLIGRYLQDPNFVRSMNTMPNAARAIDQIRKECDVFIASSRPSAAEQATQEWLLTNLGWQPHYVNTAAEGKHRIDANILVDDHDDNIYEFVTHQPAVSERSWPRDLRAGILLKQPWNGHSVTISSLIRAHRVYVVPDWPGVVNILGLANAQPVAPSPDGTSSTSQN